MDNREYVIGVDMGGTNTVYGLVNRRGDIVAHDVMPTASEPTAEKFAQRLGELILKLIEENGATGDVVGIGVGAPCANYFTGEIEAATDLPWPSPIPLGRLLSDATGLPVKISNDANAAAIGEMSYGAARGLRDFIVITLGTGVGSGIVCNGQILNGHRSFGGELGHVKAWRLENRQCACGRKDCLQTYCSAKGVVATAVKLMAEHPESKLHRLEEISSKTIAEAAEAGDEIAKEVFRITGDVLGEACAHFAAFSDPEAIILFGGVTKAGKLITDPMIESFNRNVLHLYKDHVDIKLSQLKEADAALLGASALGWEAASKS